MEKVTLTIMVEDELYEKLCAEAEREGRTPAEQHMRLLRYAYPTINRLTAEQRERYFENLRTCS